MALNSRILAAKSQVFGVMGISNADKRVRGEGAIHLFAPSIIVLATITLPNKPMTLTIPPNLHHARGLYLDLTFFIFL